MVCKQIIIKISGEIPPDIPDDDDNTILIVLILAVVALIFIMRS